MEQRAYVVTAIWDDEAKVWVAESDDVPGLVTEAPTLEA
jgi:predicted RNase H-like HicB family nuclease